MSPNWIEMPNGCWSLGGVDDCLASIQLNRSGFFFASIATRAGKSCHRLDEAKLWCESELKDLVMEIQDALSQTVPVAAR